MHQAITGGFRLFNVDEEEALHTQPAHAIASAEVENEKMVESVYIREGDNVSIRKSEKDEMIEQI